MRYTGVLTAAAFIGAANAHTRIYGAWVNGVDQGDGRTEYIRSPPTNDPVKDVTSADLVCNVAGATAAPSFVSAAAGDKLTFEWYHDSRSDDIIASSHKGPIITYIAPYFTDNGASGIWTKIAEDGYSGSTWAVDTLIANKGKYDFTLPSGLAAGKYVIRQEIIALHEADTDYSVAKTRGAQFYPSCVQVEVTGSGTVTPSGTFNFNTGYTEADPGIVFNLYGSYTSYTIPGPAVDTSLSGGSSSGSASTSAAATSTKAASSTAAAATSTKAATTSAAVATTLSTSTKAAATSTQAAASPSATAKSSCSTRRKARRAAHKA